MNFKEIFDLIIEEEGRIVNDAFGYRFDLYAKEGYSEEPHIHFYSKQTGNNGALSLLKADYYDHGDCAGRLEKEPYKYIIKKLKNDNIFKSLCIEWNNTSSCKKFIDNVTNPYSGRNIII